MCISNNIGIKYSRESPIFKALQILHPKWRCIASINKGYFNLTDYGIVWTGALTNKCCKHISEWREVVEIWCGWIHISDHQFCSVRYRYREQIQFSSSYERDKSSDQRYENWDAYQATWPGHEVGGLQEWGKFDSQRTSEPIRLCRRRVTRRIWQLL